LAQAPTVVLLDRREALARAGAGPLDAGDPLPPVVFQAPADRVHVEPLVTLGDVTDPRAAVVVALRVGEEHVGWLLALFPPGRVRAEDARVVGETAALVSAQLGLSVLAEREARAATAELRALRAQISPHFVYNAMAAIAALIHTAPDDARELLIEFADFTRYAFREQRSYVPLADELRYVEKYLRLEQARFGDRLEVRVEVAPETLGAAVPVLSLQPLVENAIRHGVEGRRDPAEPARVSIVGVDRDRDVELRVSDDGPGVDPAVARSALAGARGGIGLRNVDARLRTSFGAGYGLRVQGTPGEGTVVRMLVPKYRAEVRATMAREEERAAGATR
ncbi:sensor histidine kinase, partial [Patulibacter sp. S7RM1-6]